MCVAVILQQLQNKLNLNSTLPQPGAKAQAANPVSPLEHAVAQK